MPGVVLGVFRSADRRARVEVIRQNGRQRFRVWRTTFRIGDCYDVAALESLLRDECGVGLGDLVED